MHFWFAAFPDLPKPIGGIKQMHRVAEALSRLGHQATLIQDDISFHPNWFVSSVSVIDKKSFLARKYIPECDYLILAETFLPALYVFAPEYPVIIFNQNAAYTFGINPESMFKPLKVASLYSASIVKQVWCVSQHDYRFLLNSFPISPSKIFLLCNALEQSVRMSDQPKKRQICFMTRKNADDSRVVTNLLSQVEWLKGWSFVAIKSLTHAEVINVFQESLIFLSFGHPEGFGLPVAEAMACGCAVVGYHGLGGRELFLLGEQYQLAIPVEFGDWYSFITSVATIRDFYYREPLLFDFYSTQLSKRICESYNFDNLIHSLKSPMLGL